MECGRFARYAKTWKGRSIIFGCGLCGSTWGFKIVRDAKFDIECYVDNYKAGGYCNGLPVRDAHYLVEHTDVLCFVAVMGIAGVDVLKQLEEMNISNVYVLPEKDEFLFEFAQYLDETNDEELIKRFHHLMDDKEYLTRRFKERMGYTPDIDNPKSFNEKLQWLKLYDRKRLYTTLVDKYAVKRYVSDIVGEKYVIPTLGLYNEFDEIDFNKLPKRFVLKCTHDSGSIVMCNNKEIFDKKRAKEKLEKARMMNYFWPDREWPYYNVPRRIIAEEYIESKGDMLEVYKIFCFMGHPELIQVIQDDKTDHETIDYYDVKWNLLDLKQNFPNSLNHLPKPEMLDEMLRIAHTLSKGFPFIRVDLYVNDKSILFSEFTFFTDSGAERFYPNTWDEGLGNLIKLPVRSV